MPDLEERYPLLEATAFAARAHRNQLRKDGQTPYVSHVYRVGLVVRDVFDIKESAVVAAAILHDTLEDTTTDFDDLAERFGEQIAWWVALLSKDMRLPEAERERAYHRQIASAPWQVKICKLADIFDNLADAVNVPPEKRRRIIDRSDSYLAVLRDNLPDEAKAAYAKVNELLTSVRSREGA